LVASVGAGLLATASAGCSEQGLSEVEIERLHTLGPLPSPPTSRSNAVADDPGAAELGAWLFGDESISLADAEMSCADCHHPGLGWGDDRALSQVAAGGDTPRHSPSLTNVAYQPYMFWNGKADSLWAQAYKAMVAVHGIDKLEVVTYLGSDTDYVAMYEPLFGTFPGDPGSASETELDQVLVNCAKAIEAFERTLNSTNSDLDRWIAGDDSALSEQQERGAKLFVGKAGCVGCHSGPNLSDGWFHNIGLAPGTDGVDAAAGLAVTLADIEFNLAGPWSDDPSWGAGRLDALAQRVAAAGGGLVGAHKTPTLRDVNLRVSFGHNGDVGSLWAWISRYRDAAVEPGWVGTLDPLYVPRDLSDSDIEDLIVFLDAMTGDPSSADAI